VSTAYRHTQVSWVIVVAATLMLVVIVAIGLSSGRFEITLIVPLAIVVLAVINFGWMTVTVSDQAVTVVMGTGLMQRTVPTNRIRQYALVRNPWYRGVGVRLYSHRAGTSFSVWGFDAVELITGDGNVRIGSNEPDKLLSAIRSAVG
jgi:hypothetical protein